MFIASRDSDVVDGERPIGPRDLCLDFPHRRKGPALMNELRPAALLDHGPL
jgi:hypothetical protein